MGTLRELVKRVTFSRMSYRETKLGAIFRSSEDAGVKAIETKLKEYEGDVKKTAKFFKITPVQFYRYLRRYPKLADVAKAEKAKAALRDLGMRA